jgi:Mn2+/Fe2+ NRAMP family transporter
VVLPFVLIFMLILINDGKLMGKYTNGPFFNGVAWVTVTVMIILTLLMTIDMMAPGVIGRVTGI